MYSTVSAHGNHHDDLIVDCCLIEYPRYAIPKHVLHGGPYGERLMGRGDLWQKDQLFRRCSSTSTILKHANEVYSVLGPRIISR